MSLNVKNLSKTFSNNFDALIDISFRVNRGEALGLIGPNGAGKTTTLKIIKGVIRPTTGTFSIENNEFDYNINNSELKHLTGFLPEDAEVISYLTVYQYLEMVSILYEVPKNVSEKRITQFLKLFNLENKRDALLGTLSRGMKQKVLWAATLIHNPPLILLDDPLHALDVHSFRNVIRLINRLKELEKTILLSTHYLALVEKTCDKIAFISEGQIQKLGTIEKILEETDTSTIYEAYLKVFPDYASEEDFRQLLIE